MKILNIFGEKNSKIIFQQAYFVVSEKKLYVRRDPLHTFISFSQIFILGIFCQMFGLMKTP